MDQGPFISFGQLGLIFSSMHGRPSGERSGKKGYLISLGDLKKMIQTHSRFFGLFSFVSNLNSDRDPTPLAAGLSAHAS